MPVVDDPPEVGVVAGVVAVELVQRRHHLLHQGVAHRCLGQDVVGGDAGLAGVEALAPHDAPGGHVQVGVGGHDGRALPAQLQGDRGEVACRSSHHHSAHVGAAGEQDVVEALLEQGRGLGHATFDHHHGLVVHVVRDQAGQHRRAGWGQLARLGHDGVAGPQGGGHRCQQQLDRVVPGRDDQRHAQRLGDDPGLARQRGQRERGPAGLAPRAQVLEGVLDVEPGGTQVGAVGLHGRTPEVVVEGPHEVVFVAIQHGQQPLELGAAPLQRSGLATPVGLAHALDQLVVGRGGRIGLVLGGGHGGLLARMRRSRPLRIPAF